VRLRRVAPFRPAPTFNYLDKPTPYPRSHSFICCDMSDQSESSRFQVLFASALQDYEKQTGIPLPNHPLAEQLQNCQSVELVTTLLQEQAQAFSKFRGSDKIMKLLKSVVSVLSRVSAAATLGQDFGLVCPGLLIGSSMSLIPLR
jgi:hypothetical protein